MPPHDDLHNRLSEIATRVAVLESQGHAAHEMLQEVRSDLKTIGVKVTDIASRQTGARDTRATIISVTSLVIAAILATLKILGT